MSELAELPKHTYLIQSWVQVVVDVGVQSSLEAVPATPVVVVIVAVATGPEAVPGQRVVNPNPMPLSRAKRGSFQPRTFGSVTVPPGYARWHEPRGFGCLNVLLGHARGHGPQRFGRVNVSPGCVETSRAEIWRCECAAGPGSETRAAGFSHSVFAGPCVEAGSREI